MTELQYNEIAFYVVTGILAAIALLIYIRKYPVRKKYNVMAVGLVAVATIYVAFSVTTVNWIWITVEVVGLLLFLLFVWMAFHYSMWFVVFGWMAHIIWDMGVHPQETAPYVPYWYAWICVGFDAVIAAYLALSLIRHDH